MRQHLNLEASFKRVKMFAIALTVFGTLFVTGAKAQTTWTVTVDVSSMNKKPVYTVGTPVSTGTPCAYKLADQDHPEALKVCQGDTVLWTAKTVSGKYDLYVYQEDSKLLSSGSLIHVTDLTPPSGGTVGLHKPEGFYEYYVAVVDPTNGRLYIDDPKIMIGTGTRIRLEDQIKQDCRTLINLPDGSESTKNVIIGCHEILEDTQKHPAAPAK